MTTAAAPHSLWSLRLLNPGLVVGELTIIIEIQILQRFDRCLEFRH